jgi:diphosphomevalonate decarboxylase
MKRRACCRASPSLALTKYWGKADDERNLPATSSLAVTLGGLYTETVAALAPPEADRDEVRVDGAAMPTERYAPFFTEIRRIAGRAVYFDAESKNSFPSAAGLASSSSGFAALACACSLAADMGLSAGELSAVARLGSASAARSVFGGFVLLPVGASRAEPLYGPDYWSDFRVVIAITSRAPKGRSSRRAMRQSRETSPYYGAWLESAVAATADALDALAAKDIEQLGEAVRLSCMRMHAVMLAGSPPVLFWNPATLAAIEECGRMRLDGIGAWETIDAGPQVKVVCLSRDVDKISERLRGLPHGLEITVSSPGREPHCELAENA